MYLVVYADNWMQILVRKRDSTDIVYTMAYNGGLEAIHILLAMNLLVLIGLTLSCPA